MSAALPSPLRSTRPPRRRASTETSMFGSSRREAHDSTAFYRRFALPDLSEDNELGTSRLVDEIFQHDARDMYHVADNSVALGCDVTSILCGQGIRDRAGRRSRPCDLRGVSRND